MTLFDPGDGCADCGGRGYVLRPGHPRTCTLIACSPACPVDVAVECARCAKDRLADDLEWSAS